MPSRSKAQHDFFQAIKHNRKFARKAGVPQKVARNFIAADAKRGKKAVRRLPDRVRTIATGGY